MSIERVMRKPPITALLSDTISHVVQKMVSKEIGAIIILSRGLPAGIIAERDIVEKVVMAHKDPENTYAQDVMSTPLIFIDSDKTVADAINLMHEKRIRRLAVTSKGRLV